MLFNPIRFVSRAIALCALVIVLAACANHPPFTAQNQIDLDQFAGKWYTIANIPYFMEANKVATSTFTILVGVTISDSKYKHRKRQKSFDIPLLHITQ